MPAAPRRGADDDDVVKRHAHRNCSLFCGSAWSRRGWNGRRAVVSLPRCFARVPAGYVLKQSPTAELLRAIRAVAKGEQYVDASLPVARPLDAPEALFAPGLDSRDPLSAVEERVLHLLARAHSNQEIAQELGLGVDAVAGLRSTAMRKAHLTTRLDVIAYASARGWT